MPPITTQQSCWHRSSRAVGLKGGRGGSGGGGAVGGARGGGSSGCGLGGGGESDSMNGDWLTASTSMFAFSIVLVAACSSAKLVLSFLSTTSGVLVLTCTLKRTLAGFRVNVTSFMSTPAAVAMLERTLISDC